MVETMKHYSDIVFIGTIGAAVGILDILVLRTCQTLMAPLPFLLASLLLAIIAVAFFLAGLVWLISRLYGRLVFRFRMKS